ncbi:MAG: hypothetical protein IK041_08855, partial [Bacteroidales bacterium]|nr:hypothetical protein [Bacteroidales bacterium]
NTISISVMKKNIIVSLIGVAAAGLLLSSCSAKPESVTAVVAGPDGQPAAVVVKYAKAVSAESVTADAFQIEGQEIENVFVTDKDITAAPEKPECKEPKPECDSTKACPEGKPECKGEKPECDKAEKAHDCGMDPKECEANNHECCPEEKPEKPECEGPKSVDGQFVVIVLKKACPEKPACEGAECDSTKAECPEAKPECDGNHENCEKAACDSTKHECKEGKPEKCPEIAVPEISVNQVKDIKAADGKVLKAWGKAFPATKAVPFFHGPKGPKHHHGEACPEGKPECDGQHKDCPKAPEGK